jgi:predicted transcriptional regulator
LHHIVPYPVKITHSILTIGRSANIFALNENFRPIKFMSKTRRIDLTRRESQIMEILHRHHRATVEEIREELPEAPSPQSVRKLLEIMIERNLLAREYEGPRFVYFPSIGPEEAGRSALKDLVRTFFDNSPSSAIAALIDATDAHLSEEEYRRLSALLKQSRKPGDKR